MQTSFKPSFKRVTFALVILSCLFSARFVFADGKVIPPRNYKGSLEERAQEAIIIFHGSNKSQGAKEDLILKIHVEGNAETFAWVVPFPSEPKITKEDPKLFKELFNYVEARKYRRPSGKFDSKSPAGAASGNAAEKVQVLSRQVVGEFDVTVVREKEDGGLNPWLEKEGFQTLENAEDVLGYYRERGYVFACMKVTAAALAKDSSIESHPLRFTFLTSGRDAIYFPMKMTSLQEKPFDVNLYVFYRAWLNDKISRFGYQHRGFALHYRDWDTKECVPNGGKSWSLPESDPFLKNLSRKIPTVTKLFQKLHPGEKYYLTNIKARNVEPEAIRQWSSDLWLFPYYTNRSMVPYDARPGGPAADAYPNVERRSNTGSQASSARSTSVEYSSWSLIMLVGAVFVFVAVLLVLVFAVVFVKTRRSARISAELNQM